MTATATPQFGDPVPRATGKKNEYRAGQLRKLADGLQKDIDHKGRPQDESVRVTRKRSEELSRRLKQTEQLRTLQAWLRALADANERGTVPTELAYLENRAQLEDLLTYSAYPGWQESKDRAGAWLRPNTPAAWLIARQRMQALAAGSDPDAERRARERELLELRQQVRISRPDGFFPTPSRLAERLVELAEIAAGDEVLEPTAGDGAIAQAIRDLVPAAKLTVQEIVPRLRRILELRGFTLGPDEGDFLMMDARLWTFDRIVANFPFERHQSRAMLRHAYELLNPGGRAVAIVAPNAFTDTRKAWEEFAGWFDAVGGTTESLPGGTFAPDTQTGGILVILDKPAGALTPAPGRFVPKVAPRRRTA